MAAKKKAEAKDSQEETSPASYEGEDTNPLFGPSQDDLNPAYAPKGDVGDESEK